MSIHQDNVDNDMGWSSKLFMSQIFGLISKSIGGGYPLAVESSADPLRRQLDVEAGIDFWQVLEDGQMRGIASRVQITKKPMNTFTIRFRRDSGLKTEFAKRRDAIKANSGYLFPHLTVHAYAMSKIGMVSSIGIARTKDVIEYCMKYSPAVLACENAEFLVCPWDDMIARGYQVQVLEM